MTTYDARVGDTGTTLIRFLQDDLAELGDLTGATVSVFVRKPCGTVATWSSGFTAGTYGRLTFVTPDATYWDCVGDWTWDVSYTLSGVTRSCDRIYLRVGPA